jgi:hypothetical protein
LRKSSFAAFSLALAAVIALLVPSVASAAPAGMAAAAAVTCSGSHCTNTDPVSTGCSATAITAKTVEAYEANGSGIPVGYVDLRYSTACRTTWARYVAFYPAPNGELEGEAGVIYSNNSNGEGCQSYNTSYSSSLDGYTCYTDQLYDGGTTSYADGQMYDPSTGGWSNQVKTGAY